MSEKTPDRRREKEALEVLAGWRGQDGDRAVRLSELQEMLGIAEGPEGLFDETAPPAPTSSATPILTRNMDGTVFVNLDESPVSDFDIFRIYAARADGQADVPSGLSDEEFVRALFSEFFGRQPAASGVDYWTNQLASYYTRDELQTVFAVSFESAVQVASGPQTQIAVTNLRRDVRYWLYATAVDRSGNESEPLNCGSIIPRDTVAPPAPTASAIPAVRAGAKDGEIVLSLDPSPANDFRTFCVYGGAVSSIFDLGEINEAVTDEGFVTMLFEFYFSRPPGQSGLDFWLGQLTSGALTRQQVAEQFSFADENLVLLAENPDTTQVVGGFEANTEYRIVVTAKDTSGNESPPLDLGTVFPRDTVAPPTPTADSPLQPLRLVGDGNVLVTVDEYDPPVPDFAAFRVWGKVVSSATDVDVSSGTNAEFVTSLFHYYFDREPKPAGLAFWVGQLDTAAMTRTQVAAQFAAADEDAVLLAQSASTTIRIDGLAKNRQYTLLVSAFDIHQNESGRLNLGTITPDPISLVDVQDGKSVAQLTIYRRYAAELTVSDTPSGGEFDFENVILNNVPAGWSVSLPAGTDPVWASDAIVSTTDVTVPVAVASWSTPTQVFNVGEKGKSVYKAKVFTRTDTDLASATYIPAGGSFDFGNDTLTPPTDQSGSGITWADQPPAGETQLWASIATFSVQGETDTASNPTWSQPFKDAGKGADGVSTFELTAYTRAPSRPLTPVNGSYDFDNETFATPGHGGDGYVWSNEVPDSDGNPVWESRALASAPGPDGEDTSLTWTTPRKLAQDGEQGPPGDATNGKSAAFLQVFRRDSSQPEKPSGGFYNFGLPGFATPSGWSLSAPSGSGILWASTAIATSDDPDGVDANLPWSTPFEVARDGEDAPPATDGRSTYQAPAYARATSRPGRPQANTGSFDFENNVHTPPNGSDGTTWTAQIPAGTDPVWVSFYTYSISGDTDTASAGTWTVPELLAESGEDAKSTFYTGVFARAASRPATPTGGNYDFTENQLNLTTGSDATGDYITGADGVRWYKRPPDSDGNPLWESKGLASIDGATDTDFSISWQEPGQIAQDGGKGADGISSFMVEVFKSSNTILTASDAPQPNEGHFDFSEPDIQDALDFSATGDDGDFTWEHKNGWRPFLGGSGKRLYVCRALASATGNGVDTTLFWTGPFQIAEDGDDAVAGDRGAGRWYVPIDEINGISSLPSNASEAENAWNAWVDSPGDPVPRDQAIFYTGTASNHTAQKAFIYDGDFDGDWIEQAEVIDGNLLIAGTLTADSVVSGAPGDGAWAELNKDGSNTLEFWNDDAGYWGVGPAPEFNPVLTIGGIEDDNGGFDALISSYIGWGAPLISTRFAYTGPVIDVWATSFHTSAKAVRLRGESTNGDVMLIQTEDATTTGLRIYDGDPNHLDIYPNNGSRRTDAEPLLSLVGERKGGNLQVFQNGFTGAHHAASFYGRHTSNGSVGGTEPGGGSYDNEVTIDDVDYGAVAIICTGSGNAFYAEAGNYAPFTGEHEALVAKTEAQPEPGDILVDVEVLARRGMSNVTVAQVLADTVADKRVVGVLDRPLRDIALEALPNAFKHNGKTLDEAEALVAAYRMSGVNSLGEGQINVCGRGGDIAAGDLIVSSDLPGKGQRQDDDIMRASTVAKARESVTFDHPDQVKTIACTYHCG